MNDGLVQGINGLTISGTNSRIENLGRVEVSNHGTGSGVGGILFSSVTASTLINAGQVLAMTGIGVRASGLTGSTMQMDNSGLISGATSGVVFSLGGGSALLQNSGIVTGDDFGISTFNTETSIVNAATGRISSTAGDAITTTGVMNIVNNGEISALGQTGRCIVLGSSSGFSTITNHGTISTTFGASVDASGLLIGGAVFLYNHGTITGNYIGSGAVDVIRNFGVMEAVSTNTGSDTVRNAGLIDSFILMSSGNDTYRGYLGRVEGYVDGGLDNDTLLGGGFDDDLRGGSGDDLIEGKDGNDTLTGSLGADTIKGARAMTRSPPGPTLIC